MKHLLTGPSQNVSLITFGAPPTVSHPIKLSSLPSAHSAKLALNLANEFDPIPRADRAYFQSLKDLFKTELLLNNQGGIGGTTLQSLGSVSTQASSISSSTIEGKKWTLPPPQYWHLGDMIVLRKRFVEDEDGEEDLQLELTQVRLDDFAEALFCRRVVHSRVEYSKRLEDIGLGNFNGRKGWGCAKSEA